MVGDVGGSRRCRRSKRDWVLMTNYSFTISGACLAATKDSGSFATTYVVKYKMRVTQNPKVV